MLHLQGFILLNYFLTLSELGPCSSFDNDESDCGTNGECVTYIDTNGIPTSFCKCSAGYYGPNCNCECAYWIMIMPREFE